MNAHRPAPRLLLLLLPLLACVPTPKGDGEAGDPIEGCECIVNQDAAGDTPPDAPQCGEQLCPTIVLENDQSAPGEVIVNPEDLDSILTALRDRTPGLLSWSSSYSLGQFTNDGYILIHDDGRAVRREWGRQDLSYEVDDAQLGELEDSSVYDGCLASDDDFARFDCARRALASTEAVCDTGWFYSYI